MIKVSETQYLKGIERNNPDCHAAAVTFCMNSVYQRIGEEMVKRGLATLQTADVALTSECDEVSVTAIIEV